MAAKQNSAMQSVTGMHDILPQDIGYWHLLENCIRNCMHGFGYEEIRTPIVEYTPLFHRSLGEITDVVAKEMYTFESRGGESLSLRPECTASLVRSVIQHTLVRPGATRRLWYTGPMFRAERPQHHRYRQFHQVGAEAYGWIGPQADVEIILLTAQLWRLLDLPGCQLHLNTLGNREEQLEYRSIIKEYFFSFNDQLDEESRVRLERNPLRILDSKLPAMQSLIAHAPTPVEILGNESLDHFEQLKQMLDAVEIPYKISGSLVRGLDYYTQTVFEWTCDALGEQIAICGGGRYDKLFTDMGGKDTPAVGFSAGLERIVAALKAISTHHPEIQTDAYVIGIGKSTALTTLKVAETLRNSRVDLSVITDIDDVKLKTKLKRADKHNAQYALLIGDDEVLQNKVVLRNLKSGEQEDVAWDNLAAKFKRQSDCG